MARYQVYKDPNESYPWFFRNLETGEDEGSCATVQDAFAYALAYAAIGTS